MIEDDGLPSAFTTAHELGKSGGALGGARRAPVWGLSEIPQVLGGGQILGHSFVASSPEALGILSHGQSLPVPWLCLTFSDCPSPVGQ